MARAFLALASSSALFVLGAAATAQALPSFGSEGEPGELAARIVEAMAPEEVVGQVFMISYPGTRPDADSLRWIKDRGAGGVKIFGWNAQDERALVESIALMQSRAVAGRFKVPLLVATDQEGGWIRHVGGRTSQTPGNMALGASGFPEDAYDSGRIIGRELAALGINMDFAPDVDVASNTASWIIGSRAFSDRPMDVAVLGAAFARGLGDSGVVATAKHYPGHGDTALDSHVSLPVIKASYATLWGRELLPYRVLAKDGVPAVMSGHLSFPNAGGGNGPASMSKFFIEDVLRGKIGFTGMVITDDLRMSGAADWAGSLSEAVLAALRAGNDMVMMSSIPPEEAWAKALAEYKSDPAFRARCREAAARVLAAKLSKLRGKGAVTLSPDYASLEGRLPDPEARTHSLTVSAHAVTFIKQGPLPLQSDGAGYLIAGQYSAFIAEGLKAYPRAKTYRYATSGGKESRAAEAKELVRLAKSASVVILSVGNDGTVPFLEALRDAKPKVVAVSFFSPAALGPSPRADAIVACYSSSAEAFNAAFAAIKGAIPARGMLPIRIP